MEPKIAPDEDTVARTYLNDRNDLQWANTVDGPHHRKLRTVKTYLGMSEDESGRSRSVCRPVEGLVRLPRTLRLTTTQKR